MVDKRNRVNTGIKICFISFQSSKGGITHYVAQLANAISNISNNIVIFIGIKSMENKYFENNIQLIKVLDCPTGYNIKKMILFKNIKLIDQIAPDIIHIQGGHLIMAFYSFYYHKLSFLKKYPIVVTVHDVTIRSSFKSNFLHKITHYLLFKIANVIIVHGETIKDYLGKKNKKIYKKITVVPHGMYTMFLDQTKNIPTERDTILFFGYIREYKGLKYLIKAVPLISKEIPDLKVIIAGEGEFSKYYRLITDTSKFEIHNKFIPDEMVSELFQRAELLVLPYLKATQSGPLHIACAFKKPVVATSVGAIPEVVYDGISGFIVPPKDPEALAEAIVKLLKDEKLRKKMGENAYRKMKEELSWDKIAEKTIEVYKAAIREKHANK